MMDDLLMIHTENEIAAVFNGEKEIVIAAASSRLIQVRTTFTLHGIDIYCELKDPLIIKEIKTNSRVGFIGCTVSKPVRGNAIARQIPASQLPDGVNSGVKENVFLVRPYRIQAGPQAPVIEKTKKGWAEQGANSDSKLRFWLEAMRIISAPMSIMAVVIGTLIAMITGKFDIFIFLAAAVGGLAAHMGVNLYSDYNDFKNGFDTPGALSSHTGVLTRELIPPSAVLLMSFVCFGITAFAGLYLIYVTGWAIIAFGLAGLFVGASYTGWPAALKYRAMGEITTAFLMGPVMVTGAYFVQTGHLNGAPIILSLCPGLLVGSVTLANNIRDMDDDYQNGFVTLPIKTGLDAARKIYAVSLIAPFVILAFFIAAQLEFYPVAAAFLSLPFAVKCIREIFNGGSTSAEVRANSVKHPYPLFSIRLYIMFTMLFSSGLIITIILMRLK